jgi:hypothetical protein
MFNWSHSLRCDSFNAVTYKRRHLCWLFFNLVTNSNVPNDFDHSGVTNVNNVHVSTWKYSQSVIRYVGHKHVSESQLYAEIRFRITIYKCDLGAVLVGVYGRYEIAWPSHPQSSRECLTLETERLSRNVGKQLKTMVHNNQEYRTSSSQLRKPEMSNICVCVCVCVYIYIEYICIYMCVCARVYILVYIYVYMYMCVTHIHIHMYVCVYVYGCLFTTIIITYLCIYLIKGKGHPITGHQGPRGGVEV